MAELLTTEQAAEWLGGMTPRALVRLRQEDQEPGSLAIRIGHRTVRYRKSDLESWLDRVSHRDGQAGQ